MPHAQTGIFSIGDGAQGHFELDLQPGVEPQALGPALAALRETRSTVSGVNVVAGFRPELWQAIAPSHAPQGVRGFNEPLCGPDGFCMPATQHDLWLWFTGSAYDVIFDRAREAMRLLNGVARLAFEVSGWPYRHNRDLTGFEDGTANPDLLEAPDVALVADGEQGAGSSIVLLQQWRHDMKAFEALGEREQELVIGRTKGGSQELDEAVMPRDAHVPRTTLEENGNELPIFRRNVPYGNLSDHGTMFVGFSAHQDRLQRMLERMAGIDGIRDALTRFSQPQTGSYYVVPSTEALAGLAANSRADAKRKRP